MMTFKAMFEWVKAKGYQGDEHFQKYVISKMNERRAQQGVVTKPLIAGYVVAPFGPKEVARKHLDLVSSFGRSHVSTGDETCAKLFRDPR